MTPDVTRWGVIGPGGIAGRFAEAMTRVDDGTITAVASRSPERAAAYADRFGVAARHGDVDALLADPDVDAVYVATPHARHEADATRALEAGKHVLCEKPLALDAAQAGRLVDVARREGRFLMEAIWSRFLPSYRILVDVVGSGGIGTPLAVEASFGFRRPVDPAHRLFDRSLGGGALLDVGIYPVQLCHLLLGAPIGTSGGGPIGGPVGVAATGVVGETGVDEQVAAVLHHPGGGLGVVQAAIRLGLPNTARISGTDGWVELPAFMHAADALTVAAGGRPERVDASYGGDGLRFEVAHVHECLAAGLTESPIMPLADSLAIATTLDAILARLSWPT